MSGAIADKKRLIQITDGNIRNSHIYVTGHYDFFPSDIIGASSKRQRNSGHGMSICIELDGLDGTVETDIGTESRSGKPRRMFRGRKWVREFFDKHKVKAEDVLELERLGEYRYRLSVSHHANNPPPNYTVDADELFS